MELNLVDQPPHLPDYFMRITAKANSLFPSGPPSTLRPALQSASLADSLTASGVSFTLENRTPEGSDLVVIKANIPSATGWLGRDTPLL